MSFLQSFERDCLEIRKQSPLIHNITNYVAMTPAANALLAIGASPLMSFCPEEMTDIVSISSALAINVGCLDSTLVKASRIAAATALSLGKKWALDPVGVGASGIRTKVCVDLALNYHPSLIRCNASEAIALAREMGLDAAAGESAGSVPDPDCGSRGVDSHDDSEAALPYALLLSRKTGAVVSVSGAVDYITDGRRVGRIENGSPLMSRVTALGCTATAISAAFLSVDEDNFLAAMGAMALMGTAGQMADSNACPVDAQGSVAQTGTEIIDRKGSQDSFAAMGTGTFAVRFIDALSTFDPARASKILKADIIL